MSQPFPSQYKEIADGMGIGLYQKLSLTDASSFLGCSQDQLETWSEIGDIECIQLPEGDVQFFGYQLVSYLLNFTSPQPPATSYQDTVDRIIRANEVHKLTGLGRTTIWRYEKNGQFPKRVPLGTKNVGWKLSEVQEWIDKR